MSLFHLNRPDLNAALHQSREGFAVSQRRSVADHKGCVGMFGRRYRLPTPVAAALRQLFVESVEDVLVIEHSRYARVHCGMAATTRLNLILLAFSGTEFVANPELLLHEYFHVLRQWRTGRLTRSRYLIESVRRGYMDNRFEREARDFAAAALPRYRKLLIYALGPTAASSVEFPPSSASTGTVES